jgi:hypothetical protein
MLKDPNHKPETPYDLLGLSPAASRQDLHQALPNFMRKNRDIRMVGRAQEAVRKLQSPKARAAVDIFFYDVDTVDMCAGTPEDPDLSDFCKVEVVPLESLYSDLMATDLETGYPEIADLAPGAIGVPLYALVDERLPPIEYDC